MELGYVVGWLGVFCGLLVAPPQLLKIIKHKRIDGISLYTYIFLCLALTCYLIYALSIRDAIFITAQSINLATNGTILVLLIKGRNNG